MKKGFTLLEMIIVIAILAILSGIGIPIYVGIKKEASLQVCQANRITFKRSYMAYRAEGADNDKVDALKKSVQDILGTYVDEDSYVDKTGDVCRITYSDDELSILSVTCDKHGDDEITDLIKH